MKRSQRLLVVVDMAKRAESEAAEFLAQAQNQLNGEAQRLRELDEYYAQYEQTQTQLRGGVNASDIEKIRTFLQQLANAKQAQKMQVERMNDLFRKAKEKWQECHLKHKLMCDMVERMRLEEQAVFDKLEQKLLDEWFTSQNRPD